MLPRKIGEILKPTKYISNGEERIGIAKFKPGSAEELNTLIDHYKSYNIESFRKDTQAAETFNVNKGDVMLYETIRDEFKAKVNVDLATNEQYKVMEVMQAQAGLIRRSDIPIQPAHLKEQSLKVRQEINALEARDKSRFRDTLATQFSYGTLGRELQMDKVYIDNYIKASKRNNTHSAGTYKMLTAMSHEQLKSFADDQDRLKQRYTDDGTIIPSTADEILDFMETLGLHWDSKSSAWT